MDNDLLHAIANTIIEYFALGIIAGDDILSFADSTLGITAAEDIARLLSDPDLYGEGLYDLVFYPSQQLRESVETFIPPEGLSDEHNKNINGLILGGRRSTRIYFSKTGQEVTVNLSGPIICRFLKRLNLHRRIFSYDSRVIASAGNREFLTRVRVIMRNARYTSSPIREKFLADMIDGMVSDKRIQEETIMECLAFMLNLFGEGGHNNDIYSMISEKKRSIDTILAGLTNFNEYSGRYSMEYLMSQRIQGPAVDLEDIRNKIYLADLICLSVYGQPADSDMLH